MAGMTATFGRIATRWFVLGRPLGQCSQFATPGLMADWYSAFDRLPFDGGDAGIAQQEILRKLGEDTLVAGEKSEAFADMSSAEKETTCKVKLEAVNQILREQ